MTINLNVVKNSINSFILKNEYLLMSGLCERCIVHHIANEIRLNINANLDVDVEYNKAKINKFDRDKLGINNGRVFPDIVIHKRGTQDFNECAIELKIVKKDHKVNDGEIKKLIGYRICNGYKKCYFISVARDNIENRVFYKEI